MTLLISFHLKLNLLKSGDVYFNSAHFGAIFFLAECFLNVYNNNMLLIIAFKEIWKVITITFNISLCMIDHRSHKYKRLYIEFIDYTGLNYIMFAHNSVFFKCIHDPWFSIKNTIHICLT